LMLETGFGNLEVKMDFKISVRDVRRRQEKRNKVGCM
jgi:hypothetical protein